MMKYQRTFVSIWLLLKTNWQNSVTAFSTPFGDTSKNVATQVLQGAGPASVDLNRYNIDLPRIEKEWTVQLVQNPNEQQARVVPALKSPDLIFKTATVKFPRHPNAGLCVESK